MARTNDLASAEAAFDERETSHESNVVASIKALEQEQASVQRAKLEDAKAHKNREICLIEKENDLLHREAELTEAVEAMEEIFAAVEAGEAEIVNSRLHMPQWPDIVSRMRGAKRDYVSSPICKLVSGFVGLVFRLSKREQEGEAPVVQNNDAPMVER